MHGHIEAAKMLVRYGANVNHADEQGWTPPIWAAKCGQIDLVRMLVYYGAIIPPAISAQQKDIVIQALTNSGISELALAIITRDRENVTRLLITEDTIWGRLIGCCLPHPYRSNSQEIDGMTALQWAVAQNYAALVEDLLAEYKPDLTIQDNEGNTLLHLAARNGNDLVLQVLLAHGAHIDGQNTNGDTPLYLAIRAGRTAIVRQLLQAGAHVNIRNHQGLSAWSLAQRYRNRQDIIDILEPVAGQVAGQALLNLLSTEGQQGRSGVLYTNNNTNGTAQPLAVVPNGVLPAEIAAHIAHLVVTQRQPAEARSNFNPNSNS